MRDKVKNIWVTKIGNMWETKIKSKWETKIRINEGQSKRMYEVQR